MAGRQPYVKRCGPAPPGHLPCLPALLLRGQHLPGLLPLLLLLPADQLMGKHNAPKILRTHRSFSAASAGHKSAHCDRKRVRFVTLCDDYFKRFDKRSHASPEPSRSHPLPPPRRHRQGTPHPLAPARRPKAAPDTPAGSRPPGCRPFSAVSASQCRVGQQLGQQFAGSGSALGGSLLLTRIRPYHLREMDSAPRIARPYRALVAQSNVESGVVQNVLATQGTACLVRHTLLAHASSGTNAFGLVPSHRASRRRFSRSAAT